MNRILDISVPLAVACDENKLKNAVAKNLSVAVNRIFDLRLVRRSVDSRQKTIHINLSLEAGIDEPLLPLIQPDFHFPDVSSGKKIHIAGAGPAGLFCALRLIELGFRPIIVERGKMVGERKKDVALLNRNVSLNPESNYSFGEGGAGTFSDGKLYSRSNKRGNIRRILELLTYHGTSPEILVDSHPHIGSDKLPKIISNIRTTILNAGGEFHFSTKLTGLKVTESCLTGFETSSGIFSGIDCLVLATGHGAHDIFDLLVSANVLLEAKPFAMGVRVEHPQALIDQIRYHGNDRCNYLPAASYTLNTQVNETGVYSFCMCPGGYIVPASTATDAVVVNGMSPSKRNSPFANAGIVVEIPLATISSEYGTDALRGLRFQTALEQLAKNHGGEGQIAPAQRLTDFIDGKFSSFLPACSYLPGIKSSSLHEWLPKIISAPLRKGFKKFGFQMQGFITKEAIVTGVESRTSSPVRIPRNPETFQHVQVRGLFPCGEGAGYAGGIMSSALDGVNCAEKIAELFQK